MIIEFQKNHEAGMTPSTPVIPLIYALKSKLEDIKAEGVENRYARHARLNKVVRDHITAKGSSLEITVASSPLEISVKAWAGA